jgi:MerR family transcriptional regulator/heat shock protein HspR
MHDLYLRGAAATAAGVCQATLIAYERKGLLAPARASNGQRLYTASDIARAREIRAETRAAQATNREHFKGRRRA